MAQTKIPKIVQDIKDCLHDVKKEYQEGQVPITDDSIPLHKFCAKLEYLLQIDMKARNSVWRGRLDYWDYIYQCLSKIKGLNDGVRFVKAMNEIKSSLGRGRAFIRYSLVHHRLGDSLQQCFSNSKATSEWYKPTSVLINQSHTSAFLNDLYDLNDIQIDLAPTGHDLDTAWPTFARKSLRGVSSLHLWTPPSRSSSISSLSSQPSTTDGMASPQMESFPVFGMEEQYEKLQEEFEECEQLNRQLRQKIDQLEKESEDMHKLAMETEEQMGKVQSDLERRNQDLEYQVDKVSRELKSKGEVAAEFEDSKERTKEAEKLNADLYARIDVLNMQHESREKMLLESERTLQEKLQGSERELSDFKLQVHSLRGELEARKSTEGRRVEQVQELEAKITSIEGKNVELLARMESMVQDKDDKVSSHFESANKVHELLAKLEGVEHQNISLKGANDELSRKVQGLEETRTKCNTEVEILRGSLEERNRQVSENSQQVTEKMGGLENENQTLRIRNNELTTQLEQVEKQVQDLERERQRGEEKCGRLQKDLDDFEGREKKLKQEQLELRQKVEGLENGKQVLQRQVDGLESNHQESREERQRLRSTSEDTEKELLELKEQLSQMSDKKLGLAQTLEEVTKKVPILESERDKLRQDFNNLGSELQTIKEKLQEEEDSHRKTTDELQGASARVAEFENQVKVMNTDIDGQKQSVEKVNVEFSQLQKSMNDNETALNDLKKQLQASQNELKSVQKAKDDVASHLAEAKQKEEKSSETISRLEAENQRLEKAKNVLKDHLDREKLAKKSLEDTMEDLRRTHGENVSMEQVFEDRKVKMVQEHEDRVEFLTHQFNMANEDLEKANQEKQKADDERQAMADEHAAMKEQLEMALHERNETKEVNQALNTEIASVNEGIEAAQEERKEIANKLEQISDETTSLIAEKSNKLSELEEELEQTNKVKGELESKVSDLQETLEEKAKSLCELEEKCKEVEEQLGSMQDVKDQEVMALKFQLSSEAMQYQDKLQAYQAQESQLDKLKEKCEEQDSLIASQQREVVDLNKQLQALKQDSQKQMTDVHNKTTAKENDFKLLQDSLTEMTKMLEEQKVTNMDLEEAIHSLKSDQEGKETELEGLLSQTELDNVALKRNLIKLVKEKDTLWQWTDKLEHQRKMKASERWMEDKEVIKCMQCEIEFGIMVRRHHCRLCGRIFCFKCCSSFLLVSQSKNKVRVCEQCFVLHHHSIESDSINTSLLSQEGENDVDDVLLTSRLRLSSRSSSTNGTPTGNGEGFIIGPLIGPGDMQARSVEDDTRAAKFVVGSASSTPTLPISPANAANRHNDPRIATPPKSPVKQNPVIVLDNPLPGAMVTQEDDSKGSSEPDFDIISEEEVLSAKEDDLSGASLKSTTSLQGEKSVVSAVMTTKELEAGFGCDAEIQIRAGHSHSIPIQLDEPGLILCWEFASAPKTIAFSVTYKQTETAEAYEELIPLCKCNSHRHAVQGELISRKDGVYTLVFDNQFSRFTSKVVKYSLQIKRPEAAY